MSGSMEQVGEIDVEQVFSTYKPFSYTFVLYPRTLGVIGKGLALLSLAPVFIVVSLVTVILSRRDWNAVSALIGLLANEVVNAIAKELVDEPRPRSFAADMLSSHGNVGGNPSNHAQFMGYAATWVVLWLLVAGGRHWSTFEKFGVSLVAVLGGMSVCASRVLLEYHYLHQVVLGWVLGVGVGLGWTWIDRRLLHPYIFPALSSLSLFRYLNFRDLSAPLPSAGTKEM